MLKKILFVLFIGVLIFTVQTQSVDAKGLVPCGGTGEQPCTFCHFIVGIKDVIEFIRNLLVVAALFVITVAGVMWLLGDTFGLVNQAKKAISGAVAGIIVVLTAWLMVMGILTLLSANDLGGDGATLTKTGTWSFECSTKSFIGGEAGSSSSGTGSSSSSGGNNVEPNNPDPLTVDPNSREAKDEDRKRELLAKGDVGINKGACPPGQSTGCTNIGGMRTQTISGITDFKKECGANCDVVVTGGSEGSHKAGTYSHANGYKADLRLNNNVNKYIESNYKDVGIRSDGAKTYHDGKGNYYAKEGNHWDVCYGCNSPTGKK